MTNYFAGVNPVLNAGFRYLDNKQRVRSNEYIAEGNRRENARQFDVSAEMQKDQFDKKLGYDYEKLNLENEATLIELGIKGVEVDGANVLRSGMAVEARARGEGHLADARSTDEKTFGRVVARANSMAAAVNAQIQNVAAADFGGDRMAALEANPALRTALEVAVNGNPAEVRAINRQYRLSTEGQPFVNIPGTDEYAIKGKSDVNGQDTVATTQNEVVADNPNAIPVTKDLTIMVGQLDAMSYAAGFQSEATLRNLQALSQETQLTPEQMADPEVIHSKLKEVSQHIASPTEAVGDPQVVGNEQAAPAAPQPDKARQMVALNALTNSDPDRLMDFQQRGTMSAGETEQSRGEETAANTGFREAARREQEADIADPNRMLKASQERAEIVSQIGMENFEAGVTTALGNVDFTDTSSPYFDYGRLPWWKQSDDPAENQLTAMRDIRQTTLNNPDTIASLISQKTKRDVSADPKQWSGEEWREAATLITLSRQADHQPKLALALSDAMNPFGNPNTRRSTGEISKAGMERYLSGQHFNERVKNTLN